MNPIQLFDPASSTYTYILFDEESREALLIDPVDAQLERDLAALRQYGLQLRWTVETHAHADHITSAGLIAEHTAARTAAPAGCDISTASVQLEDGDFLQFGEEQVKALATPGHTAGSMCFLWKPRGLAMPPQVFTGDTLLINGCGRTDFQSGSASALFDSITRVLWSLPDETVVWPGHDYHGRQSSTIAAEKAGNVRLAGKDLTSFVATMESLALPYPRRMDEAVPANRASGLRHEAGSESLMLPRTAEGYAGDVSPQLAWEWVQAGHATLVDVRTDAEREWVGFVPGAQAVAWKQWPGMHANPDFDESLVRLAASGKKIVLLCRSGVRSIAAARRAHELGIEAYNILEGFEGDPDGNAQRGHVGGWRHHGLPWRQR